MKDEHEGSERKQIEILSATISGTLRNLKNVCS
jgi:hypothetical protein